MGKYSGLVRSDGRKITNTTLNRVGTKVGKYSIKAVDLESTARDTKYILECDICSEDKELYPYGSITSNWGNLNKGQVPCGCSTSVGSFTEQQTHLKISRLCKEAGYTFKGWGGGYDKHHTTYLDLICDKGHIYNTSTTMNFIRGHRCITCSRDNTAWYFYSNFAEREDNLYLMKLSIDGYTTLKIGRSFDINKRQREYKNIGLKPELLYSVEGCHVDIYLLERELLTYFNNSRDNTFPSFEGGRSECVNYSTLPSALIYLEKYWEDYLYYATKIGDLDYEVICRR